MSCQYSSHVFYLYTYFNFHKTHILLYRVIHLCFPHICLFYDTPFFSAYLEFLLPEEPLVFGWGVGNGFTAYKCSPLLFVWHNLHLSFIFKKCLGLEDTTSFSFDFIPVEKSGANLIAAYLKVFLSLAALKTLYLWFSEVYLDVFFIFILFWVYSTLWEKAMAPHSSTLAWKIPWTEEPGRLQYMELLRVGDDWATSLSLFTFMHWRRKWQPTPVLLPGESQGRGSLVGFRLWGRTESDTTVVT